MNPSEWKIADQIKYKYLMLRIVSADESIYDLSLKEVREQYELVRKLKRERIFR